MEDVANKKLKEEVSNLSELSLSLTASRLSEVVLAPSKRIEELTKSFTLINTRIQEAISPITTLASIQSEYLESIKSIQESITLGSLNGMQEALKPFADYQDSMSLMLSEALSVKDIFKDYIVELPWEKLQDSLSVNANVAWDITSLKSFEVEDEYILEGSVENYSEFGLVGLRTEASFQMRIQSLEERTEENNEILKKISTQLDEKDKVIDDLLNYIKKEGTTLAKIQEVNYVKHNSTLVVNKKPISLNRSPNQRLLAQILFSDKESRSKKWDNFDLQDAIGERWIEKDWNRIFYDAARQLNIKIKSLDNSLDQYIIATMNTIMLNPAYQ